ncbi:hypothetical protein [Amycolatopsis sp. NPDC059657]|uniref:hypothetical protein n=1 Tax=Amycolatopsis sp. NPDC059657 TaxID=3346899 RepID=UPI00366B8148
MTTAADTREDLVPLRTGFDLVWRGYDQDQVEHYMHSVEAELRLVTVDRDAAVARAENLARRLEAARAEVGRLHERVDRIITTMTPPEAARLLSGAVTAHSGGDLRHDAGFLLTQWRKDNPRPELGR